MSFNITTAMVAGYNANISLLLQRMGPKLPPTTTQVRQDTEFEYYDRIGAFEMNEILVDGSDTEYGDHDHSRVQISMRDFDGADKITRQSQIRTLANFQSPYARNMVMGMGRKMDDIIINGFFGDTKTGKAGATTTTWAGDGGDTVAVDYVDSGAAANANLNVAKLRKARQLLLSNHNDPEREPWYCGVTSSQLQSLLATTEVGSVDYNNVHALVTGQVDTFMGFKFIHNEAYTTDGSSYREIPVWTQSAMIFAVGMAPQVFIDRLPTKRQAIQVYLASSFGVARTEGGKVVQILCDETVIG